MTEHRTHTAHDHVHGAGCGHTAVAHGDHADYAHEGHLHHPHDGHVDEHELAATAANPADCTPEHACAAHDDGHVHGPDCQHSQVPHAGHIDYLVDDHLHQPHQTHCDDHGLVAA